MNAREIGRHRGREFRVSVNKGEYATELVEQILAGHRSAALDENANNRWSRAYSEAFLKGYEKGYENDIPNKEEG